MAIKGFNSEWEGDLQKISKERTTVRLHSSSFLKRYVLFYLINRNTWQRLEAKYRVISQKVKYIYSFIDSSN